MVIDIDGVGCIYIFKQGGILIGSGFQHTINGQTKYKWNHLGVVAGMTGSSSC